MTYSLSSADISIFYQKSTTFVILRNTDRDCILMHNFYFFQLCLSLQGLSYGLEICGKKVESISQKILGSNPFVCRSYSGKTDRGALLSEGGGGEVEFIQNFYKGEIYLIRENFVGKKFSLFRYFFPTKSFSSDTMNVLDFS